MSTALRTRLRFNIIYIPGTVRYLSFFVLSLLKWSDCSYRLVSNGCLPEEVEQLKKLCSSNSRLEFLMLSTQEILRHSEALTALQKMERSDHFCFMDSDILATGYFLEELLPCMEKDYFAVCSGSAITCTRKERIAGRRSKILRGFHNYLENFCLGSTYFAIYNNEKLSRFIQTSGFAFERCRSWEEMPECFKTPLSQAGMKKDIYDTGKLLNILAQMRGESVMYKDSPTLVHIGRLFGHVKRYSGRKTPVPRRVPRGIAGIIREWEERRLSLKNRKASSYFLELLVSLFEDRPFEKKVPVFHPEVQENIRCAAGHITDLYREIQKRHSELFRCPA